MTLLEYYLRYLVAVCEGSLTVDGLTVDGATEAERAENLNKTIAAIGLPAFVRRCAHAEGTEIPQEVFDSFDPAALVAEMRQAMERSPGVPSDAQTADGSCSLRPEEPAAEQTEAHEKQNAYEAFLDCLLLEDALFDYLIDVLLRDDGLAFFRLSQVTVRRELRLHDFLYWLGTKEFYAEEAERACATILDACITRLAGEGQLELVAALLSGDRTTFERFRVDAPELRQLPDATFAWFEEYYLNRYYPCRAILRLRGVQFPAFDFDRAAGAS